MREITSKLTSKNQLTLPVEIRRHLGVGPDDKVAFVIQEDGTVQVRPASNSVVDSIAGFAGTLPRPMEFDEMLEIARHDWYLRKFGHREE